MSITDKVITTALLIVFLGCAALLASFASYDYNFKRQCASMGGVALEDTSGDTICVKGPVQVVTVAAHPW